MKEFSSIRNGEFIKKTVIATATLYDSNSENDAVRSELAKQMLKKAARFGYEVVVVDGGSSADLVEGFRRYARVFRQKAKGMGESRRQAFQHAYDTGKEIIIFTEPEKVSFIPKILKTVEPIALGKADIVVPKRKSLKSYPAYQQYTEQATNIFWKELTGTDLDITFGPRAWNRKETSYFLRYKGEYGDSWDCIYIPVMDALADGRRIVSVDVDFTYPRAQREAEEHDLAFVKKRIDALSFIADFSLDHWKKLNKKTDAVRI
jgi:glycosyltransferase involved in cell wall biosynthesis